MKSITPVREAYRIQFRSFIPFLLISFGVAWGILGLYIFLPELMGKVFGQLTGNHPLFFLAVYAPAIAAFILVACNDGIVGLRRFLGRALLWRCSVAWYAFLIIGIPLIFIGGSALRGNLFTEPFPFTSPQALSVALFLFSLMNPIFPDAQPYDTYILIIAAILIVWWNRKNMFTREASVTEAIPSQGKAIDD
jgi:hypothetical protein